MPGVPEAQTYQISPYRCSSCSLSAHLLAVSTVYLLCIHAIDPVILSRVYERFFCPVRFAAKSFADRIRCSPLEGSRRLQPEEEYSLHLP